MALRKSETDFRDNAESLFEEARPDPLHVVMSRTVTLAAPAPTDAVSAPEPQDSSQQQNPADQQQARKDLADHLNAKPDISKPVDMHQGGKGPDKNAQSNVTAAGAKIGNGSDTINQFVAEARDLAGKAGIGAQQSKDSPASQGPSAVRGFFARAATAALVSVVAGPVVAAAADAAMAVSSKGQGTYSDARTTSAPVRDRNGKSVDPGYTRASVEPQQIAAPASITPVSGKFQKALSSGPSFGDAEPFDPARADIASQSLEGMNKIPGLSANTPVIKAALDSIKNGADVYKSYGGKADVTFNEKGLDLSSPADFKDGPKAPQIAFKSDVKLPSLAIS